MFDPDGYHPIHFIIALVAGWGARGILPRHLGFVHPGDSAEFDDLPADVVARHVLGEKLAAGILTAIVSVYPSGDIYAAPANYWRGDGSHATMKDSRMDPRILGLDADLNSAHVLLHPDAVAAALGLHLVPREESEPSPTSARQAPSNPQPDTREQFVFEKAKAEFTGRKVAWNNAGRVTPAPTEKDIRDLLELRYVGRWSRDQVRELRDLWPEEARGRGPRKTGGGIKHRKA